MEKPADTLINMRFNVHCEKPRFSPSREKLNGLGCDNFFKSRARSSIRRCVGPLVCWSITSIFFLREIAVLRHAETNYCPCPIARD